MPRNITYFPATISALGWFNHTIENMPILGRISSLLGAVEPTRYLRSTGWLTASQIASMGLSIITTLYIARSLGPQNFGELSYVQSIVGILALFAALTGTLYRDIVRNPEKEPSPAPFAAHTKALAPPDLILFH